MVFVNCQTTGANAVVATDPLWVSDVYKSFRGDITVTSDDFSTEKVTSTRSRVDRGSCTLRVVKK